MLIFCLFLGAVLDIQMPWVVSGEQVSETVSQTSWGKLWHTSVCGSKKKSAFPYYRWIRELVSKEPLYNGKKDLLSVQ